MSTTLLREKNTQLFEEQWPLMRPTILKLLHQHSVSRSEWQNLFWIVHSVCIWDDKSSPKVYQKLQEDILEFIKQAQTRVLAHKEDQALLKAYIEEWTKFFTQCSYLPLPFGMLENLLAGKINSSIQKKNQCEESLIRKLMLDTWNQTIFYNIKHRLQDCAMKLIHCERNGQCFDSQLVIGVRESYVNLCSNIDDRLQIYRENFEEAYIQATKSFYQIQAPLYLEENGVEKYMKYADQKLREEEIRAQRYLETSIGSINALTDCCVKVLVTDFKDSILAHCPNMIERNETEKLKLMFKLIDHIPDGIACMLHDLEKYIVNKGLTDMIASADVITQDSEKYVEHLLDLFSCSSQLVCEAFNDDPRFLTARDKAYKQVVNDVSVFKLELPVKQGSISKAPLIPESKCPELLAIYCDLLLRKTLYSKRMASEEIEKKLKNVLLVLKYVQNKDVFMRFHKAHLTRRLILDISSDYEKEEFMLEWLRDIGMPAEYINKLARMFQDVKVSDDLNRHFKESYSNSNKDGSADINIKILHAGAWSRHSDRVQVSLPIELEDYIPEVEEFYRSKHNGRKLQWHHHMSYGTILFMNAVGKYDLDVTTFQMAVLFAWNQRCYDKITYESLKLATELPDPELRKTLWSLVACPRVKHQVVLYEPLVSSLKDFNLNTVFWINQDFILVKNGKVQKRGKLSLIGRLQLLTEKSHQEEEESIVQLRILRTQEAIWKIMKMRKHITNTQLHAELIDMLKNMFLPSRKMIKEQIEWLIEHNYMKRDEKDINTFMYVA